MAFERREDAEKALHALSDSQVEGRSLKLMWAKAVKVSAGASGTTGTAVIVSKDLIMDQKGVLGRTGKRGTLASRGCESRCGSCCGSCCGSLCVSCVVVCQW